MSESLLDIQMPPVPDEIEVQEVAEEEQVEYEQEEEEEEEEQVEVNKYIPDEEVFNAPKVAKVKRKCSDKQLKHLENIRKKALAKKQENKKFLEDQKAKQQRFARSEGPKKVRKVVRKKVYVPPPEEEEVEYIYEEEEPVPLARQPPPQQQQQQMSGYNLTPAQIKQLQRDAIMDYEVIRKERKQKERINEQQQYVEQERRKIMKQMGQSDNDPWSACFD